MSDPAYELSADETWIVDWLERSAKAELSAVPQQTPQSAHLQQLTAAGLKELIAAQIRLGMHRE